MSYFYTALVSAALAFFTVYLLWIFYLAVMNLARARDSGTLTKTALVLGYPVLFVGLVLDALANIFVMTLVLAELPQELTVTSRLKRHNAGPQGYRRAVALWFEPLLDPFDPSGDHI